MVRLNGVDHYTALWGTAEAEAAYERLIADWLANGRSLPAFAETEQLLDNQPTKFASPTIEDLILAFWKHAVVHYRHADGTPTSELANYRQSLRLPRSLYG